MKNEEKYFCERCQTGTTGSTACDSCGKLRTKGGLSYCRNCDRDTKGSDFCLICGGRRKIEEKTPVAKPMSGSPLEIRISQRLFFDEEVGKQSQTLSDKYKAIDSAARKLSQLEKTGNKTEIKDFSRELATRYPFVWDDLSDFEKTTMRAAGRIPGIMDGIQQHGKRILDELGRLNRPLQDLVITILEEITPKVLMARRMTVVKRLEKGMLVVNNFKSCERIFDCLLEFKTQIRQMSKLSLGEIVAQVREFETMVNAIDTASMVEEEVSVETARAFKQGIFT